MADMTLTKTRIQAGVYEGVLSGVADPKLQALIEGQPVETLSVTPEQDGSGNWSVRLAIPHEALTDGVQTFVITDTETGDTLDSFTIVTGEPLDDDLRGEIDLLRAELDMLKKAFRRHCAETS